jgi:N-acetyl sugar amidotransferase
MDTSDPEIRFDEQGICNLCTEYLNKVAQTSRQIPSVDRLQEMAEQIKKTGAGKKYDCVLGISGGVDSCYTAWLLHHLGIRVLAVHLDNGWDADSSVRNIKNTVDQLGMDYRSFVLDWEEFKDLQLAFLRASVPEIETPTDMAIPGALHKIAATYKVKYIISGGNMQTEGILPQSWHYNAKDLVYLNAIHKKFGTGKLTKFPEFGYRQELFYKFYHGIRQIYLLNYTDYRKSDAQQILQRELNWKDHGGKHFESLYTRFVHSYVLPEKFDIDYRRATFSTQICTGEITREYAVEKLKEPTYDAGSVCEIKQYVAKKLAISMQELEEILSLPVKTYKDYPNDKKRLERIYGMYRKIMGKSRSLKTKLSVLGGQLSILQHLTAYY